MIKKLKQTVSEKILLIFIIVLTMIFFGSFITIKNKCLFVKNYDPKKINFEIPENIAVMNVFCGNVIIEIYPNISPKSVERFIMLIKSEDSIKDHGFLTSDDLKYQEERRKRKIRKLTYEER